MKKINRIKLLVISTAIIIGLLMLADCDPYVNAFVIGVVFVIYLLCVAYITENMNAKELKTRDKIIALFKENCED